MKRVVTQVLVWDDLHMKLHNEEVDAARTDVALSWDGEDVTLDLTEDHYQAVRAFLADYLASGTPVRGARKRGAGPGALPPHKPVPAGQARAIQISFVDTLMRSRGYTMAQATLYLRGLRSWADVHGRTSEYARKLDGSPRPAGKRYYPRQLVEDYEAAVSLEQKEPWRASSAAG